MSKNSVNGFVSYDICCVTASKSINRVFCWIVLNYKDISKMVEKKETVKKVKKVVEEEVAINVSAFEWSLQKFVKENLAQIVVNKKNITLTTDSKLKFFDFCMKNKVNPFDWEVYAMPFYNSEIKSYDVMPVVDYKVYIKRANLSGKMDGYSLERLEWENGQFLGWKIFIKRKDQEHIHSDELRLDSAIKKDKDWKAVTYGPRNDDPEFMCKKQLIRSSFQMVFCEFMKWEIVQIQVEVVEDVDNNDVINWVIEEL